MNHTPASRPESFPPWLRRFAARLQPRITRAGRPNILLEELAHRIRGTSELAPPIGIRNADHRRAAVASRPPQTAASLSVSIPAYPTES